MTNHVAELEKIYAETGISAFGQRRLLPKEPLPSDSTDLLLYGILKALVVIGKIIDEKS